MFLKRAHILVSSLKPLLAAAQPGQRRTQFFNTKSVRRSHFFMGGQGGEGKGRKGNSRENARARERDSALRETKRRWRERRRRRKRRLNRAKLGQQEGNARARPCAGAFCAHPRPALSITSYCINRNKTSHRVRARRPNTEKERKKQMIIINTITRAYEPSALAFVLDFFHFVSLLCMCIHAQLLPPNPYRRR